MINSVSIGVLVLTHNEEVHIGRCITSVRPWIDEAFVVDSFSNDRTVDIAESLGAHVIQHPFFCPAQQKNWALRHLPITTEWLLFLDADEYVSSELRDEICAVL